MLNIFKEHENIIFYPIKPMKLYSWKNDYINYIVEPKYNGWHCIITNYNNKIGIYSRNLKINLTNYVGLKALVQSIKQIKEEVILLAEIMNTSVEDSKLVNRLKNRNEKYEIKIFDVKIEKTLEERRKYLETIASLKSNLIEQYKVVDNIIELENLIENLKENPLIEGIILKNPNSLYVPSKKITIYTNDWLKLKWK